MIYSTLYQLLNIILPLITIPYVSRVLGPEGIGINAYTGSFAAYFVLLGNLGIQLYGNREIAYHQRDSEARSKIFFELVSLKALAVLLALIGYSVFVLFQSEYQFYYLLQGLTILAVVTDISWYFMGVENFRLIVLRNMAIKILIVLVTFTLVKRPEDLWIYILLMAGATLFGDLSVWPFLRREVKRMSWRKLQIFRHAKPALLLFLPQIVIQVYLSLNKSMLGLMQGVKSAGFFNQSDMIVRTAFILTTSFGAAFLPRLSRLLSEQKKEEAKALTLKSLDFGNALAFLVIPGLMGISATFAVYFFGKDYAVVGPLMAVESLVILFINWGTVFGSQYLLATRRMKSYALSSVVGLAVNVLLNLALIPLIGTMGAIIATVLTEFAVSSYEIWTLRDVFALSAILRALWKYALAGLAVFAVVYKLNGLLHVSALSYLLQALAGVIVYALLLLLLRAPVIGLIKPVLKQWLSRKFRS
jgi:O-antigen/teichoic acid export membrane protein